METQLQKALDELRLRILEMAALAEKAVDKALRAAFSRDVQLAEEVIEGDCNVNELQCAVDEKCLLLLALDQPVARDLRFILGCTYIATNLERVGDQAVNIAELALLLAQRPEMPHNPFMEELAETAKAMLHQAVTAFTKEDTVLAQSVCEMDARADTLDLKILKHYVDYMIQESRAVERAVHLIIMSQNLERIGDLSTNIAENLIFIVKGVDIRQTCRPY
jgi:phosphate transport system protein